MRAQDMGYGPAVASLAGMTTGVFGGVMRDILCSIIPLGFEKELYASVSISAVWAYLLLDQAGIGDTIAVPATLLFGFIFRILAIKFDWHIPKFVYQSAKLDD